MTEQPTPNPNPPEKSLECPACHFAHAEPPVQCERCGIIVSKWKDPKQRQAEARLAELAKSSSKGLPPWLYGTFAAVIGIPLLIFFVPDIGARLLGGRLAYNLDTQVNYRHQGSWRTRIVAPVSVSGEPVAGSLTLDPATISAQISLRASDKDSGGNVIIRKSYPRVSLDLEASGRGPQEKSSEELSGWEEGYGINFLGGRLSTIIAAANQIGRNSEVMNQHNALRQQHAYENYVGGPPPAPPDPAQGILEGLTKSELGSIDVNPFFVFPKDRVKPGFVLEKDLYYTLKTALFTMEISQRIPFQIKSFERATGGFCTVVEWDAPVTPKFSKTSPNFKFDLSALQIQSRYKGTARFDYTDGLFQDVDGRITVIISVPNADPAAVLEAFGSPLPGDPSGAFYFAVIGEQKVLRL